MGKRNLASRSSIEETELDAKEKRIAELKDICAVLSTKAGRRFLWRLMGRCGVFSSVKHPARSIEYRAGEQDMGHFIMAEIAEADQNLLFKMMKDNKNDNTDN